MCPWDASLLTVPYQGGPGAQFRPSGVVDRLRKLISPLLRRLAAQTPQRLRKLAQSSLPRIASRWPPMSGWLRNPLVASEVAKHTGIPTIPAAVAAPRETEKIDNAEALIAALRDPRAEVAVDAAVALSRRPYALAVPALREVVENKDGYFCASTRAAAVHALKSLLPPGQGGLVAAAARDSDASVSLAAIAAIVERDDADSADILLRLLEDSTGFYIALTRQAAARGLIRLGSRDRGRVTALLQNESDPEVRKALSAS